MSCFPPNFLCLTRRYSHLLLTAWVPPPSPAAFDCTHRHLLFASPSLALCSTRIRKLTVMRFVQALRRSIKGDKDKGPVTPKSAVAIVPPKKVGGLPLQRKPQASIILKAVRHFGHRQGSTANLPITPGAQMLMPNPTNRSFEPFTITRLDPAKNSAFREATFSTLLVAKTIRIGTKHATQLFLTPGVSCPSPSSKPSAEPSEIVGSPTVVNSPLPPTTPTMIPDTASHQQCILRQPSCHQPPMLRLKVTSAIPSQSESQVPWSTELSCTTLLRKGQMS